LLPRNDEKSTSLVTQRKIYGLRIMLRDKPLWQESELKMQRQHLCRSSRIKRLLETRDWRPETPK
jgi:hypothetical protein